MINDTCAHCCNNNHNGTNANAQKKVTNLEGLGASLGKLAEVLAANMEKLSASVEAILAAAQSKAEVEEWQTCNEERGYYDVKPKNCLNGGCSNGKHRQRVRGLPRNVLDQRDGSGAAGEETGVVPGLPYREEQHEERAEENTEEDSDGQQGEILQPIVTLQFTLAAAERYLLALDQLLGYVVAEHPNEAMNERYKDVISTVSLKNRLLDGINDAIQSELQRGEKVLADLRAANV